MEPPFDFPAVSWVVLDFESFMVFIGTVVAVAATPIGFFWRFNHAVNQRFGKMAERLARLEATVDSLRMRDRCRERPDG